VRIAYLDCIGGISGDMFVGALLDAGWSEDAMRASVGWLGDEVAALDVETRRRHELRGLGIRVTPSAGVAPARRTLNDVIGLLDRAPLPGPVRASAQSVFRRLARAEARAHGVPLEDVHFHELGAVDTIVDIVCVCAGLLDLGIERLHVSSLPAGAGTARMAHGTLPLPAPATAFLMEGLPVRWAEGTGERCTPTGTALVGEMGTWTRPPVMTVTRVGTGAGTMAFPDIPNIVRLVLGEVSDGVARHPGEAPAGGAACSVRPVASVPVSDLPDWGWGDAPDPADSSTPPGRWGQVTILETQIDDATPEDLAWLCEDLRRCGGLDVFLRPVFMKKGRAASQLTVIVRPDDERNLLSRLLMKSTTLGVRRRSEWRRELDRRAGSVETEFGPVRVKYAFRGAEGWTGEPEYESCREAADRSGAPLSRVRRTAQTAIDATVARMDQPPAT
jgi:pyridinium-3,5-bisthiocarboxylic acid mononucleotide nickel chelatase